ncbi:hypothetical protein CRENBAI_026215 [Crenichthys baileyi]|uniref:Uncharacterized protein n=1 Tax=Crenichthys baileyi TaxID=28760 RepID=A0AAV9SFQ8_9TELE
MKLSYPHVGQHNCTEFRRTTEANPWRSKTQRPWKLMMAVQKSCRDNRDQFQEEGSPAFSPKNGDRYFCSSARLDLFTCLPTEVLEKSNHLLLPGPSDGRVVLPLLAVVKDQSGNRTSTGTWWSDTFIKQKYTYSTQRKAQKPRMTSKSATHGLKYNRDDQNYMEYSEHFLRGKKALYMGTRRRRDHSFMFRCSFIKAPSDPLHHRVLPSSTPLSPHLPVKYIKTCL